MSTDLPEPVKGMTVVVYRRDPGGKLATCRSARVEKVNPKTFRIEGFTETFKRRDGPGSWVASDGGMRPLEAVPADSADAQSLAAETRRINAVRELDAAYNAWRDQGTKKSLDALIKEAQRARNAF